jgi:hypothetical protein
MGGPDMAPHTPPRSGRPGEAVAPLDIAQRPTNFGSRFSTNARMPSRASSVS